APNTASVLFRYYGNPDSRYKKKNSLSFPNVFFLPCPFYLPAIYKNHATPNWPPEVYAISGQRPVPPVHRETKMLYVGSAFQCLPDKRPKDRRAGTHKQGSTDYDRQSPNLPDDKWSLHRESHPGATHPP